MANSAVEICNRALQKLGAGRINDLAEDDRNAREMNLAYDPVREAELRKHRWNFSLERVQLAADATEPAFGRARSFTLPADCLKVVPPYPEQNLASRDWVIENGKIYTNDSSPLDVRYVKNIETVADMDALFAEALACKLAVETCEALTQSNTKKADLKDDYKTAIQDAKKANAIEVVPQETPDDPWIAARG